MPRKVRRVAESSAEPPALPVEVPSPAPRAALVDVVRKIVTTFRIGFQVAISALAGGREVNDAIQALVQSGELVVNSRALKGLSMYLPQGMRPQGGQALHRDVSILCHAMIEYQERGRRLVCLSDRVVRDLYPRFKESAKNIRPHLLEENRTNEGELRRRVSQIFVVSGSGEDIVKVLHKELDELLHNPYVADAIQHQRTYGFVIVSEHQAVVDKMKRLLGLDSENRKRPPRDKTPEFGKKIFTRVCFAPGVAELPRWLQARRAQEGAQDVVEDAAD